MGQIVAETVGRRLGRTLLELGGNNGVIVMNDANLDLALRARSVWRCGYRRAALHQHPPAVSSARDRGRFDANAQAAYAQIRVGDPLDEDTLMGPLIDRGAVEAMQSGARQIRDEGGEILLVASELGGCYVEPRW